MLSRKEEEDGRERERLGGSPDACRELQVPLTRLSSLPVLHFLAVVYVHPVSLACASSVVGFLQIVVAKMEEMAEKEKEHSDLWTECQRYSFL